MLKLPKMYRVTQEFARPRINDSVTDTAAALNAIAANDKIKAGQKIGITVGSRGIQNLTPILKTAVDYVKQCGATPFLLAAMGSHGNGTAAGQKEVLDSLDITEEVLGAEVITCDECEVLGETDSGLTVFILKSALKMDGIIIINRVKTHTSFKGKVESGLIKKLVVGLGGPKGAQQFHGFGPSELPRLLTEIGAVLLEKLPILGGVAIIENAYEETAVLQGITGADMIEEEGTALEYSKTLMPALPVEEMDLLVIEEMGKNFSGTGIDTNIIGRARIHGVLEPDKPRIKRIAVLDLSEESHGNATGIGMADFVTQKMVDKMDRKATYLNCLTSTFVVRAAIPMYFETAEKLMEAALYSLSGVPAQELRIILIPNTLFLTDCIVSESIAAELRDKSGITVSDVAEEWGFDEAGNLTLKI